MGSEIKLTYKQFQIDRSRWVQKYGVLHTECPRVGGRSWRGVGRGREELEGGGAREDTHLYTVPNLPVPMGSEICSSSYGMSHSFRVIDIWKNIQAKHFITVSLTTVIAKYAGHAGHVRQTSADVRQRAQTLPDILSSRVQYTENVWQGKQEWPLIFTRHQLGKMSDMGSKCPAEHWRSAGHFVRHARNNFCDHCNKQNIFMLH